MGRRGNGLSLQGNTWVVRKAVPADVRTIVGKRELIRSTQTGDYAEAKKIALPIIREFEAAISNARAARSGEEPSKLDIQSVEHVFSKWMLAEYDKPISEPGDLATSWQVQMEIDRLNEAYTHPERWRAIPDIDHRIAEMLASGGLSASPHHPLYPDVRKLAVRCLRFVAIKREERRLSRAHSEVVRTADLSTPRAVVETSRPAPSVTIQAFFDEWVTTVGKPSSEKERGRLDHQIRRLIEFVGDKPMNYVEKSEIIDFLALVARFPARRTPDIDAMPIRKAVEYVEAENARIAAENGAHPDMPAKPLRATLTKNTVEGWFGSYRRMFHHAVHGKALMDRNPFEGLEYAIQGRASTEKRAFTDEEVKAIFSARSGMSGAAYWLPILCLFHGARMSEFAALPLAKFRVTDDGDHYFDLTDEKVKNEGSRRIIPLHPDLVGLGFLEHIDGLREGGETWLFPDLRHGGKLGPGHKFSMSFNEWLDAKGFADPGISFHSLRHTWKRRARASTVKEEVHDILSGHAATKVSRKYGEGLDIRDLSAAMAQISFPMFPAAATKKAA